MKNLSAYLSYLFLYLNLKSEGFFFFFASSAEDLYLLAKYNGSLIHCMIRP